MRISDWSSDVCSSDLFAHAYSLAKATVRNMQQNTIMAVGTVVLLLAGVLLGKIFLASGMLVHELSVLLVTLNAVRLIRYRARGRSDKRRVGKEWVSTCRSRWSPYH